jgi:hypothetical protein
VTALDNRRYDIFYGADRYSEPAEGGRMRGDSRMQSMMLLSGFDGHATVRKTGRR